MTDSTPHSVRDDFATVRRGFPPGYSGIAIDALGRLEEQYEVQRTTTQKWYDEAHEQQRRARQAEAELKEQLGALEHLRTRIASRVAYSEAAEQRVHELQVTGGAAVIAISVARDELHNRTLERDAHFQRANEAEERERGLLEQLEAALSALQHHGYGPGLCRCEKCSALGDEYVDRLTQNPGSKPGIIFDTPEATLYEDGVLRIQESDPATERHA